MREMYNDEYTVGAMQRFLLQDYVTAMEVYRTLLVKDESRKTHLYSGIGRIYLQVLTSFELTYFQREGDWHVI